MLSLLVQILRQVGKETGKVLVLPNEGVQIILIGLDGRFELRDLRADIGQVLFCRLNGRFKVLIIVLDCLDSFFCLLLSASGSHYSTLNIL